MKLARPLMVWVLLAPLAAACGANGYFDETFDMLFDLSGAVPPDFATRDPDQGQGTTTMSALDLAGPATCAQPREIPLGFHESSTTLGAPSLASLGCAPADLPAVVYEFTTTKQIGINLVASAGGAVGVGYELRQGTCENAATICSWQAANLNNFSIPGGVWYIVLVREPAGPYEFSIQAF